MNLKAYKDDSSFPEITDKNILRLYSNRFCPYSQRVRLVLATLNLE